MKSFSVLIPCVAIAAFALVSASVARANLFVNQGFEATPLPAGASPTNAQQVGAGTQITGWTTALGNANEPNRNNWIAGINQTNAAWIPAPQQGVYSVQLDSNSGGSTFGIGNSIYQTISLTANTQYQLSFYFRSETGNSNGVRSTATAYIGLDSGGNVPVNATGYASIARQTFTSPVTAPNNTDAVWNLATLNFATGAGAGGLYRFTFLDGATSPTNTGSNSNSNISLDNFDLEVVPEFSHWAVFAGFGLAVAVGSHLRRGTRSPAVPGTMPVVAGTPI